MVADPLSLKTLVSVRDELEAAVITDALAEHAIRARAVGGYTAGFRAEVPGLVDVVVGQADLAQAQQILEDLPQDRAEIDWSVVDFEGVDSSEADNREIDNSDNQPPVGQEDHGPAGTTPKPEPESLRAGSRPYQFRITTLLALQTIVGVALAILVDYSAALLGVIVVVAGTFVLIVAGTIRVGSNAERTRQEWTYLGRALIVGYAMLALIGLFQ